MWRVTIVMKSTGKPVLAVLAAVCVGLLGCSDSDDGDEGAGDEEGTSTTVEASSANADGVQRQPEGQASFFEFEEVLFGDGEAVVLRNVNEIDVSTDRLHLCQGDECSALPDTVVPGGERVVLASGDPTEDNGVVIAGVDVGELDPPDGELVIYVSEPGDPERMVNYLEWGSTPHDRTEDAIERGLWLEGSFAPSGEDATRLYKDPDSGLWLWEAA